MQSYAALKQQLAFVHASDKAAYTRAKAPFIKHVLAVHTQSAVVSSQRQFNIDMQPTALARTSALAADAYVRLATA